MHTTCPECRTSFRVSQDQLGLRRGLVRCGKCNAVFNAYDALLPELEEPLIPPHQPQQDALSSRSLADEPADEPSHAPPQTEGGFLQEYVADPCPDILLEAAPEVADEEIEIPVGENEETYPDTPVPSPATQETAEDRPVPAPPTSEAPTEPAAEAEAPQREADTPDSILLSELPNRLPAGAGLPAWKKGLYGLAILLLVLLLLAQMAILLRAELAASLPGTRPLLRQLCAPLGCVVPLPRQLDRQAIAASNLEHDPEQKSRVRLTFLLANRTGQAQTWPQVVLTLTDVRESPVAQKVFTPETYLPKDVDIAAGMAAGQERETRLELDIGNLAATGYALALAYP